MASWDAALVRDRCQSWFDAREVKAGADVRADDKRLRLVAKQAPGGPAQRGVGIVPRGYPHIRSPCAPL